MNPPTRREFLKQAALVTGGLGCVLGGGRLPAADRPEVSPDALSKLREKLKGRLVVPGDSTYESARRVFYWNPQIERRPVAVVQCGHEVDAQRAVEFARTHALEVSVRSGGHSHLAWGSTDGLVIDLSLLKQITIDPENRVIRAQAGVFSGEAARAAGVHGLVPVLGQCPGVSATGVTLGGGLGWLSGLFGASCDNLISAQLVTADANTALVNAESDPDLFWAMRGAGANFGVTTRFETRLQKIGTILGGDLHFAVRDARTVLCGFRDIMHDVSDGFQATLNLTPGERGVFISFCHAGDENEANVLLPKLRSIAKPIKESVAASAVCPPCREGCSDQSRQHAPTDVPRDPDRLSGKHHRRDH